jgi:hypothetical protein
MGITDSLNSILSVIQLGVGILKIFINLGEIANCTLKALLFKAQLLIIKCQSQIFIFLAIISFQFNLNPSTFFNRVFSKMDCVTQLKI